jgi:small membrane protein
MILQTMLILFLIFAASRVFLQWKNGNIKIVSFIFWAAIFVGAIFSIIQPEISSHLARLVGIGRGADVILYFSVAILFYLLFRLYIYVENLRHEISELISQLALKEDKKNK